MDDKLPAKAAKFTSLENLYVYGMFKNLPNIYVNAFENFLKYLPLLSCIWSKISQYFS